MAIATTASVNAPKRALEDGNGSPGWVLTASDDFGMCPGKASVMTGA